VAGAAGASVTLESFLHENPESFVDLRGFLGSDGLRERVPSDQSQRQ
jgi:hypothetical protein